jgi:hypothetical protein
LQEQHYVTLVIRLLIEPSGAIQQGTVIDLQEKTIGQFHQVEECCALIKNWLGSQAGQRDGKPGRPSSTVILTLLLLLFL